MMSVLTVLVLLGVGFAFAKKRLLPRLKKDRPETAPDQADRTAVTAKETPDFRILSFCSADFTYADDLAHCVEFELGAAIRGLAGNGCRLAGDPFPLVIGNVLLIILYYTKDAVQKGEVEG